MTTLQVQRTTGSRQLAVDTDLSFWTAGAADPIRELTALYAVFPAEVRIIAEPTAPRTGPLGSLDLDERTATTRRADAQTLLDGLATDWGLAWSEIARLSGVTVSAVRKWRAGESISSENRRGLARLAAFFELLDEVGQVGDAAGWLGMRLSEYHTVTAADLYCAGHAEDVLAHAQGLLGVSNLLDGWDPDWRDSTRSEWMVVDDPEAGRVLVRRD